jgi:AcrR family transcriptional regulator
MTKQSRADRKAETRELILDAAMTLLADGRGLGSLGLRELAREAGLAPPSLYHHFADMHALGQALIDRACYRLRTVMGEGRRALIAGAMDEAIKALVGRFLDYISGHESEFRLLVQQRLGESAAFRRRIHRELQLLVDELAEDIREVVEDQGRLPVDYLREAEAAVAVIFGFGILALDMPASARAQQRERVEVQLRMIFAGGRVLAGGDQSD